MRGQRRALKIKSDNKTKTLKIIKSKILEENSPMKCTFGLDWFAAIVVSFWLAELALYPIYAEKNKHKTKRRAIQILKI
jgi:hypothetical protein